MGYLLGLFKIPLIYFRYTERLHAAQLAKDPQLYSPEPQLVRFFVEVLLECPVNDGKRLPNEMYSAICAPPNR